MGEGYPAREPLPRKAEGLAHVTEEKKFGWRHAIGVSRDLPIADKDLPVRKEFAQVVIGASVAEPEFEHIPVELANKLRRQI